MVDGFVDQDFPEPMYKWPVLIKVVYLVEYLHETVVKDFYTVFSAVSIPETNTHAIAVKLPVKQFLTFSVTFDQTFE